MKLFVVTDIFGRTEAVNDLVTGMADSYEHIEIIDPYAGKDLPFDDEDDAYRYFNEVCGLGKLTKQLETLLEMQSDPVDLLGFSVGASAVWDMTSRPVSRNIRQAICFYGSRIRAKLDLSPRCRTSLIFPKYERGFDLAETIQLLENRVNVEIIRTDFLHGFMNRLSQNFSESAYVRYLKYLEVKARC
jgi:dienelactone hydrolase